MNELKRNRGFVWRAFWIGAVTFVGLAATGCQPTVGPIQKALDAAGGRKALAALEKFSYSAEGERFEPAQGLVPVHTSMRASSFDLTLLWDVEGDRLSFDWQREIFNPPKGKLAYEDIFDGTLGYQTGNDFYFTPSGRTSERALSSRRMGAIRREFRLLNPQVYLRKLALDDSAGTIKPDVILDGQSHHVIEVRDGAVPVELFIDSDTGRLTRLRTLQNDPLWGDVLAELTYREWLAPAGAGVRIPYQVELSIGGNLVRTAARTNVAINPELSPSAFALPGAPRTRVDSAAEIRGAIDSHYVTRWNAIGLPFGDQHQTVVTASPINDDPHVQYLTGGSHHSMAIRLDESIFVLEPALDEARSRAVLAKLDELWPGVPVSHVLITHHHFDHMGGVRTYAARGATIITSALNASYVNQALRSPHTLVPDELSRTQDPRFSIESVPVDGEFTITAGSHTIVARHIGSVHNEDTLVVYLPEQRLLFESDIYVMPGGYPAHEPLPTPFSVWAREFANGLTKLDWNIEWIAGGHGGLAPFSDLMSHFES